MVMMCYAFFFVLVFFFGARGSCLAIFAGCWLLAADDDDVFFVYCILLHVNSCRQYVHVVSSE